MKKRIIKIALMSISMLALASCKQEELVQAATQAVDNNRVVFASVEEYESLFADPNTTDEKVNALAARYGTFTENARISGFEQAEDTLYAEFLQKILNDDYIVQIGDWLIKVDMATEQVLVLDKKYLGQYADLASANLSNKNILVYSTRDDVLGMLQEGLASETARIQGLFCKETGNEPSYDEETVWDTSLYGNNQISYYTWFHKICYRRAGIYFDLYSEGNGYVTDASHIRDHKTAYTPNFMISSTTRWKLKCGQNDGVPVGSVYYTNMVNSDKVYDFHRVIYFNVKALTKYELAVRFGPAPKYKQLYIQRGY